MTDTLSTIVAHKRDLYAARKAQVALADVEAAASAADARGVSSRRYRPPMKMAVMP